MCIDCFKEDLLTMLSDGFTPEEAAKFLNEEEGSEQYELRHLRNIGDELLNKVKKMEETEVKIAEAFETRKRTLLKEMMRNLEDEFQEVLAQVIGEKERLFDAFYKELQVEQSESHIIDYNKGRLMEIVGKDEKAKKSNVIRVTF